jgi:hypothetical protein
VRRIEALAQALALAVVAGNEDRTERATKLAANIANGMSDAQIAQAQTMAVGLLNQI